jgi:CcmD family protein
VTRTTRTTTALRALEATVVLAVAVLAAPTLAFAQEFRKVEGAVRDDVPAGPFVGLAYGFIWVALLAYVVFVARGVSRVRGEIEDLRRKVDAAGGKR